LVGTSTPFLSQTGNPYTLFLNGKEMGEEVGAVGIAVSSSSSSSTSRNQEDLDFGGLEFLDLESSQKITRSVSHFPPFPPSTSSSRLKPKLPYRNCKSKISAQGNLVLTINDVPAAKLILQAVNSHQSHRSAATPTEGRSSKDVEYFAAVFDGDYSPPAAVRFHPSFRSIFLPVSLKNDNEENGEC